MDRQNNVLEYLDNIVNICPDKIAYANESDGLSFQTVYENSRAIGSFLHDEGMYKEPVVVFMRKHPETIVTFFGVITAGCYYVPIDNEMPRHRIELIFESLNPKAVICDDSTIDSIKKFDYKGAVFHYRDIIKTPTDDAALAEIRDKSIDIDPIYIVFTSGSTGKPKGVAACHRSVIDYIETLSEVLEVSENTVFGNQTPLYVDACLKEIYPTLKFGATTYIIPKELFMFPIKLLEFMNEYKINTICWVVSALTMISALGALEKIVPEYLHTVAFGSEVFPIKQFNMWKEALPDAKLINLYGPTEATGMSCYYIVDREFEPGEAIPIGRPFKNTEILLLTDENKPAEKGEQGEICIRGTSLTLGYFNDFERTDEVFVQNPLNSMYHELIYRTGDIGKLNDRNELVFVSRKDYQIKHMGHRIELGEIESAINQMKGVQTACCIFDDIKKKIVMYYVGDVTKADAVKYCREKLPRYMVPNYIEQIDIMPLTSNGKINRLVLKEMYEKKQK